MEAFYDQQVPFVVPESKCHTQEAAKCLSDRKRKFMDTELAQDTEELFQDLIQLQEIWIAEAQATDDEQFVPDFQSNNLMLHGLAASKVKREPSSSKDFSPCRTPQADMCLYSYSACEPAPTPSSTPAVQQRGSIHPTGPPPLQRQLQPSTPQLTNNCSPNHTPALSPSHLRNLPQANQSQQFAMPHPPIGSSSVSFNAEQRFQRQLSDPCLSFLPPKKTANTPYHPAIRDGRPMYQRHLSEPLVPHAPRGFKQELVDPRYPEPGPPTSGLARPQTAFNHVTIKQEPRDFGYDSEVQTCQSSSFEKSALYQNNSAGFGPDREQCLYYDDTCVVPERLEGKTRTSKTSLLTLSVAGERYVYKFVCNPEALFSMAFPDNQRPSLKPDPDAVLPPSEDEGSHLPSYEDDGPYLAEGVEQCIQRLGLPDGYPY
ncbi:ETS translocation variant 5-like [Neolamprologus brichardi]|uniref:ETS translocation variant 5-like n=1 Tax=Neolamprologus brichardi TaxID=32507 RepID=UPI001643D59A|nr:ETS translocation variant 5-like [Neolamprologus brichardi]